jgi:hypothetical protein
MKNAIAVLLTVLSLTSAAIAEDASRTPPVTIRKALDLAEKYMDDYGLRDKVFIYGITLERGSFMTSKQYWTVKWSMPLPGSTPERREIGLKIEMDGSVKRLVKERGAGRP